MTVTRSPPCTEGDLLSLREVLVDSSVQDHLSDFLERNLLERPDLSRVEDVEFKIVLLGFGDDLQFAGQQCTPVKRESQYEPG